MILVLDEGVTYASEALEKVVEVVLEELAVRRMILETNKMNVPLTGLLEELGFR